MSTITIERAKLERALEALAIADNIALVGVAYTPKSIDMGLLKIREARDVIRQAFEQTVQEPVGYTDGDGRAWAVMWSGALPPNLTLFAIPPAAPVPLTDDVVQEVISKLEPLLDAKNQSWAEAERMLHGITKGGAA